MSLQAELELASAAELMAAMLAVDLDPGRALVAALSAAGGEPWQRVGAALADALGRGEWLPDAMSGIDAPWPAGWAQFTSLLTTQAALGVGMAAALRTAAAAWQEAAWRRWQGRARWAGLVGRAVLVLCFLPGVVLAGVWPLIGLGLW